MCKIFSFFKRAATITVAALPFLTKLTNHYDEKNFTECKSTVFPRNKLYILFLFRKILYLKAKKTSSCYTRKTF